MTAGRVNLKIVADRLGLARLARERELVVDEALASRLVQIAGFRNRLTRYYDEVTPEEIFHVLESDSGDLEAFARELETAAMHLAGATESQETLRLPSSAE